MATFREFLRVAELTVNDKTSGKRMREILSILKRHDATHGMTPEKAVAILEDLGPTYVKMGQIASNRSDVLPQSYCAAFEKLRANVPPIPFASVVEAIERAYGKPWGAVFSAIEEQPLGSASIAQVHRATLLDGTQVAVKVRRPGIVQQMAEDITLMKHLVALLAVSSPSGDNMVLTLDGFVAELERTTSDELDFNVELANLVRFHSDTASQPGVSSPAPYPQYTTDDVLVMQFVTGPMICDPALAQSGADLAALGERLAQSYVTQVIDNGFFHADPHPGNILVCGDDIVWIDLGMTGTLTAGERTLASEAFRAIAARDAYALKEALLGLVKANRPVDHGLLMTQLETLLTQYGTAELGDLDIGAAMLEVVELLRAHNLVVTPAFTMMARGFLTLEGVLAAVAPQTNLIDMVAKHVERQLGDPGSLIQRFRDLAGAGIGSAEAAARLPSQLSNTLNMLGHGQIKVGTDVGMPPGFMASLSTIAGNVSLAMISTGLFIGSSVLCTTSMEPRVFEVPVLGILGYLGAFALGAYVTVRTMVARHEQRNGKG